MAAYAHLTREQLIERLSAVEKDLDLPAFHEPQTRKGKRKAQRAFDFDSYPRRKIAIKFCYWGSDYSGLAIQEGLTPLPTVEGVLFSALAKARLVDPDKGLDGCGWSRCGRTDRGVSAAGQVVSLWVRSNLGERRRTLPEKESQVDEPAASVSSSPHLAAPVASVADLPTPEEHVSPSLDPDANELHYIHALNQNLPPTIRVLAWSPVSSEFDARFSCTYRHYKYLISAPSSPNTSSSLTPPLDIDRMRDAASRLIGEQDFRNFCKLDPTKQIENFYRRILRADISPLEGSEGLYVFDLVGTAFLYHQVRHIMAILFLVGGGFEPPGIVDDLLRTGFPPPALPASSEDIPSSTPPSPKTSFDMPSPTLPIVSTKPNYRMADALPLILWDCAYNPTDVSWRGDGSHSTSSSSSSAPVPPSVSTTNLLRAISSSYAQDQIRTGISGLFLQAASSLHPSPPSSTTSTHQSQVQVHLGGGTLQPETHYTPLLKRERLGSIEEANKRWREGAKGKKNLEKMAKRAEERSAARTAAAGDE